jgi:CspA family cold shock protein
MEIFMSKGVVKWFDPRKGFGFIQNEYGSDVFVHYSEVDKEGFRCLRTGQHVEYDEIETHKGLQGKDIRVVSDVDREMESEPVLE